MSVQVDDSITVTLPEWYDARAEPEATLKGFLSDVQVQTGDGLRYRLYFIDPIRLQQTLEDDSACGRPYFTEPGLVVLPEVTKEAIRQVVPRLVKDGFFHHLAPIP
jgi:hypothetical protein